MGLRFFRRIRIAPGVTVNLSKSGVSTTLGTRGAHVTLGHGKVRETVGLPGTGLSYTSSDPARSRPVFVWLLVAAIGAAVLIGMFMGR
jgi:hypothetical protein